MEREGLFGNSLDVDMTPRDSFTTTIHVTLQIKFWYTKFFISLLVTYRRVGVRFQFIRHCFNVLIKHTIDIEIHPFPLFKNTFYLGPDVLLSVTVKLYN